MKKGISLIVLVITILVIIVLAGAVILTMVTNNPLEKANEGIFNSDVKTFAQELSISMSNAMLNSKDPKQINAWNGGSKADGTDMLEYITSMKNKQKYLEILEVQNGELVYIGTDKKEMKWAEEAGIEAANAEIKITGIEISNIGITGATIKINVNKPSAVKEYKLSTDNGVTYPNIQTTNSFNVTGLTANTLYNLKVQVVDKKDAKIEKADTLSTVGYVPTGFSHTEGNVNTGFVIKDSTNGNEFVWIPVNNISELVLTNFNKGTAPGIETIPNDIKISITNYKGFYRSRYEIGQGNVSKQGQPIFNSITWATAEAKGKEMYNTAELGSTLQYGAMWDVTCLWLQSSGYNLTDCRNWGNYIDSIAPANEGSGSLRTTGYNKNWKANNIYDMAGNGWEFTQEVYDNLYVILRGGSFGDASNVFPIVNRYTVAGSYYRDITGFSTVIYKK